jgi:guanylate kinase
MKGKIFVVTGTSGSGKTTLAEKILKDSKLNISKIVTCTTRPPRGREQNGVHYNFLSRNEFEQKIFENKFFEYAEVYGNYYGSLKIEVNKLIESGKNVLFVVDVQGAETLKKNYSEIITIFIKTPSISELKIRLEKRAEDSIERINERIAIAEQEEKKSILFDYVIINDNLDLAVNQLKEIIRNNSMH